MKGNWNDLGVILQLCHIKALRDTVYSYTPKFYYAASSSYFWTSTWNMTSESKKNKLGFQVYVFVGNFGNGEIRRTISRFQHQLYPASPVTWF